MTFFMRYKKTVTTVALLLFALLLFQLAGGVDRVVRLAEITANIAEGMGHDPHAYTKDIEISDEELGEINITRIALDFEDSRKNKIDAVIAKIRELEQALQNAKELKKHTEAEIERLRQLDAAALEEKPTHTKTGQKIVRFVREEDLPAKFKPLKKHLHEPFHIGACQICHASDLSNPARLITKEIDQLCYKCHPKQDVNPVSHKPVTEGRCIDCHDPHQSQTKSLLKADSVNGLCMKCHDRAKPAKGMKQLVDMDKKYRHKPVEENCIKCHEPHTSPYKKLLRSDDATQKLCLECHTDLKDHADMKAVITDSKYKHGPLVSGEKRCLECHDVHASNHKGILKKEQTALCLGCHDKEVKSDEDGGMLMNIAAHLKANPNWHAPITRVEKEGGCAGCHNPHGSDNFSMLRHSFTKNFYGDFDRKDFFCFSCHEQENIHEQFSTETGFRDGKVNLHFLHVNNRKGRACRACHDEHAATYPHLLRDYTDFNGIKFPLRFIGTESGGSCAPACHKKFDYDRVTPKGIGLAPKPAGQ